jgi:hypothetical protein
MANHLRVRGRNFRAKLKLRGECIGAKPSVEEIDYLLKVLGPLLSSIDYQCVTGDANPRSHEEPEISGNDMNVTKCSEGGIQ